MAVGAEWDPEILQRIGAQIRAGRQRLGLNQDDFADRAGMHRAYIGMIEGGKKDLRISTLYRLAIALDTDVCSLLEQSI